MSLRLLSAALVTALVSCPVAAGHGDGAARGYTSRVTSVEPKVGGLVAQVLAGDDQLRLRNDSGRELVIQGYEGEPYLRFAADGGVFRNVNSPATYLNQERFGGITVSASATKKAKPRWERVAEGKQYDWHDHRIHWMSKVDPTKVRSAQDKSHHVFNWTVFGRAGNERLAINGRLDYSPPPRGSFNTLLLLPLIALALAGGTLWRVRRRRSLRATGRSA